MRHGTYGALGRFRLRAISLFGKLFIKTAETSSSLRVMLHLAADRFSPRLQ